jgi:Rad3-related DNA helicase
MQELQCTMELAQTIIEICLIVPSGIICFLPNYDAIDKINKSLMECSKWEELRKQKVIK